MTERNLTLMQDVATVAQQQPVSFTAANTASVRLTPNAPPTQEPMPTPDPGPKYVPEQALAEKLDLTELREIAERTDIPWLEKRRLTRQFLHKLYHFRELQFDRAADVYSAALDTTKQLAIAEIGLFGQKKLYELRTRFQELMSSIGRQVELRELEFLTQFGEDLTLMEENLQKRHLKARFKEVIVKSIDDRFDNVAHRMTVLMAGQPS